MQKARSIYGVQFRGHDKPLVAASGSLHPTPKSLPEPPSTRRGKSKVPIYKYVSTHSLSRSIHIDVFYLCMHVHTSQCGTIGTTPEAPKRPRYEFFVGPAPNHGLGFRVDPKSFKGTPMHSV